jgi:hypothetical protein
MLEHTAKSILRSAKILKINGVKVINRTQGTDDWFVLTADYIFIWNRNDWRKYRNGTLIKVLDITE